MSKNTVEIDTIPELLVQIDAGETPGEQMKIIAKLKAPVDAYCTAYKDATRDVILAEQSNSAASELAEAGHSIVEAKVTRKARSSQDYRDAAELYTRAREALSFLITYSAGIKMDHEKNIASEYRMSAEIKANTFATGR